MMAFTLLLYHYNPYSSNKIAIATTKTRHTISNERIKRKNFLDNPT